MSAEARARLELAPWEIGRPQQDLVRLEADRQIEGPVLDIGCGAGDNALHLSSGGYDVTGIDASDAAIEVARNAARERGLSAEFVVADALELERLGWTFATAFSSGFFQTLAVEKRPRFARSLASVLRPGGRYYQLVVSDEERAPLPPNKVSRADIEATFASGWEIEFIRPARLETNVHVDGARAWLSAVRRAAESFEAM